MGNQLICESGATNRSVEFYERYKDSFGNVIKAEMQAEPEKVIYLLTLTNEKEETLKFNGGLTAGYVGEGPSGTLRVLKLAGFDITREYIAENKSFIIEK